jgi:hypothetical protein
MFVIPDTPVWSVFVLILFSLSRRESEEKQISDHGPIALQRILPTMESLIVNQM